ncbi:MAG: transporter [Gammaproteobacteria bacterium]|nr:transporter [Gammaproteobacteria bacterium]
MQAVIGMIFVLGYTSAQAYVGLCCGKCGGNMPMNIPGGGIPETHEFRIKISPMFMRMDGLRDGTNRVAVGSLLGMPVMMGQPTGKFMAVPTDMDMNMFHLTGGYSFTDDFFAGVMFMWKQNSMGMKFNKAMQGVTGQEGFAMKSDGIGDTMLMGKYRLFTDDPLIPTRQASLLFGLNLPTGSINARNTNHPLVMRQQELLPYSMQLGSGTFDPTLGALYQASRSPWWWGVNAVYTARLYDNERNYRLGNEFRLDLYGMYQFRYNLVGQIQLNTQYQGKIRGEADESRTGASGRVTRGDPLSPFATPLWDGHHYGGTQTFVTVGFQWQPAPLHIVDFNLGIPLYRNLNGPQLEQDYRVMLTWYLEIPTKKSRRYGFDKKTSKGKLGF